MNLFSRKMLLLLVLLLSPSPELWAVEPDNPLFQAVKKQLKHPEKPFTMIVTLKVNKDFIDTFKDKAQPAVALTRQEKGCLSYDLNQSTTEPGTFIFYERWKSLDDLALHLTSNHLQKFLEAVGEMLEGEPALQVALPVAEKK